MKTVKLTKKEAKWIRAMSQNQLQFGETTGEAETRANVFAKMNHMFPPPQQEEFTNTYPAFGSDDEDIDDIPF